jgi:hypothetical protein
MMNFFKRKPDETLTVDCVICGQPFEAKRLKLEVIGWRWQTMCPECSEKVRQMSPEEQRAIRERMG